jgi:hypothetical protein
MLGGYKTARHILWQWWQNLLQRSYSCLNYATVFKFFSELFQDIYKRMNKLSADKAKACSRVIYSLPNVIKYLGNPNNKKNNMTGWNADVKYDSW